MALLRIDSEISSLKRSVSRTEIFWRTVFIFTKLDSWKGGKG